MIIKKFIVNNWPIIAILALAAVLRLWNLGNYPALNADEAALGYNAYSLIETGMDEHRNSWPIHFQSFNDYKPGFYVYLTIPFVYLFGLAEWAVRLPGAISGVITVFLVYLLVKKIAKSAGGKYQLAAVAASLILAISPWHIHFSRGAWEVTVATLFVVLATYLFLVALQRPRYYFLSLLFFVLSLYTYHSARVIAPLLGLGLVVLYRNEVLLHARKFIFACLVALVLIAPLAIDFMGEAGASRFSGVGLFADTGPLERIHELRGDYENPNSVIARLFHNKALAYGIFFVGNWLSHYSGDFLLVNGDIIERSRVPGVGQIFFITGFFAVLGLYSIAQSPKKEKTFIFWWLVIAPVAAALTFQSPHALRAQNMVVPLVIISAFGAASLVQFLQTRVKSKNARVAAYAVLVIILVWELAHYQLMYWGHMAKEYKYSSQYGVPELVDYLQDERYNYENIVVTTRYDQPYILFLFYMNYPPEKFQSDHTITDRDEYGFSTVPSFENFRFERINWKEISDKYPGSLIAVAPEEIVGEANVIKEIYGTNGRLYFKVIAN